ncbi:acyl-CoA-binding domain-containing protein 4 [Striga asiatica]|uniref:Acyl-CoA-binding domain-containing protein 4 n=1 Tax=Striga asiatica TaxID=4170 RepID=A0A5A7PDY5_STRAF|nr:acyl-CoA-binding domain-containing protein 4 [Striga asiatica]
MFFGRLLYRKAVHCLVWRTRLRRFVSDCKPSHIIVVRDIVYPKLLTSNSTCPDCLKTLILQPMIWEIPARMNHFGTGPNYILMGRANFASPACNTNVYVSCQSITKIVSPPARLSPLPFSEAKKIKITMLKNAYIYIRDNPEVISVGMPRLKRALIVLKHNLDKVMESPEPGPAAARWHALNGVDAENTRDVVIICELQGCFGVYVRNVIYGISLLAVNNGR